MKLRSAQIGLLLYFVPLIAYPNIRAISFSYIPGIERFAQENQFVLGHLPMLEEWYSIWEHAQPRKEVQERIEKLYSSLGSIESSSPSNIDVVLYRGVLAHYLYNLEADDYYEKAITKFDRAISINPGDYRGKWFKGVHLAKALMQPEAFELLDEVARLKPWKDLSPYFWADYAEASHISGMACHAIMAAKHANQLFSEWEKQQYWKKSNLDFILNKLSKDTDPTACIQRDELWNYASAREGEVNKSYQLGIRFLVNQEWRYQSSNYENGSATVLIKPKAYKDKQGNSINSSIAIIMHVEENYDSEAFLVNLEGKFGKANRIELPISIKEATSYEILSKSLYPQLGGAHLIITIIKRPCPENPGVALEAPVRWEAEEDGQPKYFRPMQVSMRINKPIYFVFLLDIAASVFDEALRDYLAFLNDMMILE